MEKGDYRSQGKEESIMRDSSVIRVLNGIYGDIVKGVVEGTNGFGYSFYCSNNTFMECNRRKRVREEKEMNGEYSNRNYTSRISLSNTSSHTITNCTFTGCKTTSTNVTDYAYSCGGALCFYRSSSSTVYSVSITDCIFTSCTAYGWGGAVYCDYASSCVVRGCSFVNCKNTSNGGGGGIYIYESSLCAGVKESNFSSCTSGWGGGVFIFSSNVTGTDCVGGVSYGIVSGCRFSDCNATDLTAGGGSMSLCNISLSTIRSCYLYNCHTSGLGGCFEMEVSDDVAGVTE